MAAERTRTYSYLQSDQDLDFVAELDGLEFMHAVIAGRIPAPSIGATLGFDMHRAERGMVRFRGDPGDHLMNPLGVIHGGFGATMLDAAMACAVHTMADRGKAYTTAELSVNMVRAIMPDTGPLIAEGKAVHAGRTIGTAEGRLYGEADGKLYAHGTTTCVIVSLGKQGKAMHPSPSSLAPAEEGSHPVERSGTSIVPRAGAGPGP